MLYIYYIKIYAYIYYIKILILKKLKNLSLNLKSFLHCSYIEKSILQTFYSFILINNFEHINNNSFLRKGIEPTTSHVYSRIHSNKLYII